MKNKILLFLSIIMFVLLIFLGIYFINNYNKCIFYSFSGRSKNIQISGIAYMRNNYTTFRVYNITQSNNLSKNQKDMYVSDVSFDYLSNDKSIVKVSTFDGDIEVDENKDLFTLESYFNRAKVSGSMFTMDSGYFNLNYNFERDLKAVIQYVSDNKIKTEIVHFNVDKIANNKLIYN